MAAWARTDRLASRKAIVVGDLNVAPLENDVWNHKRLRRSVGHTPLEAERMKDFWAAGELIDVPRHFVPEPEPLYTWWGYRFPQDRKSVVSGKSVSVRVDLGGRRILKKKT